MIRSATPIVMKLAAATLAGAMFGGCAMAGGGRDPAIEPRRLPIPFQVIAHRGASAVAPENTLPAFHAAHALGAVEAELDVQLSRDGVVVLFHDQTLDEKTNGRGAVRDMDWASLRSLDIGAWFDRAHPDVEERFAGTGLITLDTLFEELGDRLFYHVELKVPDEELPRRTLEVIDAHGLRGGVLLTSFDFAQLERVRGLAPELPTCLLVERLPLRSEPLEHWIDRASDAGFTQVGVAAAELTPDAVAYARQNGLWIRAWRVRGVADMEHAVDVGSNGMTIDWPEKLLRRLVEGVGTPGALR